MAKQNRSPALFCNKTRQFFSGQSDWPADNSRKVRLAGMPATAGSLPPMNMLFLVLKLTFWRRQGRNHYFKIKAHNAVAHILVIYNFLHKFNICVIEVKIG